MTRQRSCPACNAKANGIKTRISYPHVECEFSLISKTDKPSIIFTKDFPSFDDLIKVKEEIQQLKLVPIKSDEIYEKYHSIANEDLISSIEFTSNVIFLENMYPYLLPEDISQNIIWIKDNTSEIEIHNFIKDKYTELSLSRQNFDAIIFERPLNITTKLVKGSFPQIRHIHFWFKK